MSSEHREKAQVVRERCSGQAELGLDDVKDWASIGERMVKISMQGCDHRTTKEV